MMSQRVALLFLLSCHGVQAVTPIAKVITLLEDLKAEVKSEGEAEAKTYDEFACFCRDTTEKKATSITQGQDDIDQLSAEIGDKTADKAEKISEVEKRQTKQEQTSKELQDTNVRCQTERSEYEATSAELSKAITTLEGALKALEQSKPTTASLLAIKSAVEESLALADTLDLLASNKQQAVTNFLQGGASNKADPSEDPEYSYHSQGIIDILQKLEADFRTQKTEVDAEYDKAKKSCDDLKASLTGQMDENGMAIKKTTVVIDTLKSDIASARGSLVDAEGSLKDDQVYLKDLTVRCETRAKDWDQRSELRASELEALTQALHILKNDVQGLDTEVNKRALLLEHASHVSSAVVSGKVSGLGFAGESFSLLETGSSRIRVLNLLKKADSRSFEQTAKAKVISLLNHEGHRLGSGVLASLASRVAEDPFVKVKELIQKLIERLLRESTAEASKKGFCDTELGKATQDRDFRFGDVQKLNADISGLEAKKDELEQELKNLAETLTSLNQGLEEATNLRADEKAENLDTVKQAKEGVTAVSEAITILKVFYKQSAKAKVFLQASPVDEDTSGPGFDGAYKGKQESSKGIVGLLETIKSDFERTLKTTQASEKKAAADFVEFDRTSRADIGAKETKTALDEQDLEATTNNIVAKMKDLQTNMDLLDDAVRTIEDLKPACIDTGMSYAERVAKREEETAALKKALCILDEDKVETECK